MRLCTYGLPFTYFFPNHDFYQVIDIGCGPGQFAQVLAKRFQKAKITAVDASDEMLKMAQLLIADDVKHRISFVKSKIQELFVSTEYDLIVVCNTLHHFQDPMELWETVVRISKKGTFIFVIDPKRPDSKEEAEAIVERISYKESKIMKLDHLQSLMASFQKDEVIKQVGKFHKLKSLEVFETKSHLYIWGTVRDF